MQNINFHLIQGNDLYNFLIDCISLCGDKRSLLKMLGFSYGGTGYKKLYKLYESVGINLNKYYRTKNQNLYDNDDIFIANSKWSSSSQSTKIKKRIVDNNLLPYRCVVCGNLGFWMGQVLVLQIHHKNGVNNDNRLDNLEFLCPNCHTQTDSFAGKNR